MKTPDLTVRKCVFSNIEDLNAIGMMINAYIEDEMGGGELLTRQQQSRLAEALSQHPKSIVLIACVGGVRCGLLVAFENFSTFTVSPMINIHDVIVLKEYRGKGGGKKLLEAIINIARERQCSRVTLEVRTDNPVAKRLYKSVGFSAPVPGMLYWRINLQQEQDGAET
jgi:ribosomal protein S18 acetylase RimI-like enzyme